MSIPQKPSSLELPRGERRDTIPATPAAPSTAPSATPQKPAAREALEAETGAEIADRSTDGNIKADRNTLCAAKIEDIRYTPILLAKGLQKPIEEPEAETKRRINAYTDGKDAEGWYTLNYERLGKDSTGFSHEMGIGLGDILIDPNIREIEVDRGGEIIKATRAVVSKGRHNGRVGFVDENGDYIATHTGDKFKIIETETAKKTDEKYLEEFRAETDARQAHKKIFESQPASERLSSYSRIRSKTEFPYSPQTQYKEPSTEIKGSAGRTLTVQDILDAEKESWKRKGTIVEISGREKTMRVVNFVAREIGTPAELIVATAYRETGGSFDPEYTGDSGLSTGWGHIRKEGRDNARKDPRCSKVAEQALAEDPKQILGGYSLFLDIYDIAIKLKTGAEFIGISMNHTTVLSKDQLSQIRQYYHTPGYFNARRIGKEASDKKYGRGYYEKAITFFDEKEVQEHRYSRFAQNIIAARSAVGQRGEGGVVV